MPKPLSKEQLRVVEAAEKLVHQTKDGPELDAEMIFRLLRANMGEKKFKDFVNAVRKYLPRTTS